MRLRGIWAVAVGMLFVGSVSQVLGQSRDKNAPAPLQSGVNSASVDSLIGPHYWYFFVEPGVFQLSFSQGGAQGFAASGKATIQCGYAEKMAGNTMTIKDAPEAAVFSGSVKQRARVACTVQPPNSSLVRSTVAYTLTATGSASFGQAADTWAAIVGMYKTLYGDPLGALRFNADGTIEATNGQTGSWKLFDKASQTYVVVIAGKRTSFHFDPGRGLIDMQSGIVVYSR